MTRHVTMFAAAAVVLLSSASTLFAPPPSVDKSLSGDLALPAGTAGANLAGVQLTISTDGTEVNQLILRAKDFWKFTIPQGSNNPGSTLVFPSGTFTNFAVTFWATNNSGSPSLPSSGLNPPPTTSLPLKFASITISPKSTSLTNANSDTDVWISLRRITHAPTTVLRSVFTLTNTKWVKTANQSAFIGPLPGPQTSNILAGQYSFKTTGFLNGFAASNYFLHSVNAPLTTLLFGVDHASTMIPLPPTVLIGLPGLAAIFAGYRMRRRRMAG